jgi:asparagine synthase (glutamine-hydrolysing)
MPIGDWIKGQELRLGPLAAAQPGVVEIADPAKVRLLFRHRHRRESVACGKHILALRPVMRSRRSR